MTGSSRPFLQSMVSRERWPLPVSKVFQTGPSKPRMAWPT